MNLKSYILVAVLVLPFGGSALAETNNFHVTKDQITSMDQMAPAEIAKLNEADNEGDKSSKFSRLFLALAATGNSGNGAEAMQGPAVEMEVDKATRVHLRFLRNHPFERRVCRIFKGEKFRGQIYGDQSNLYVQLADRSGKILDAQDFDSVFWRLKDEMWKAQHYIEIEDVSDLHHFDTWRAQFKLDPTPSLELFTYRLVGAACAELTRGFFADNQLTVEDPRENDVRRWKRLVDILYATALKAGDVTAPSWIDMVNLR